MLQKYIQAWAGLAFSCYAITTTAQSTCESQHPHIITFQPNRVQCNLGTAGTSIGFGQGFGQGAAVYTIDFNPNQMNPNHLYASGLIFTAKRNTEQVMAFDSYLQTGADFYSGILLNDGTVLGNQVFKRIFVVNRAAVEQLRADFADNGTINNTPAMELLQWPGRNNPHFNGLFGISLPNNEDLAPFVDVNNDGTYNPMNGDYPIARTAYPNLIAEQLAWSVLHTACPHTSNYSPSVRVQVEQLYYGFNCTNDPLVAATLFSRVRIKNKETQPLTEVRLGLWTDFDLGCLYDDYIGCASTTNTYFVYNKDAYDDINCGNSIGLGSNPPVTAITLLNQPLYSFSYYVDGTFLQANNIEGFNRLLQGIWPDSTPITPYDYGYNPTLTTLTPTRFAFSGNPNQANDWTMFSNQTLSSGDLIDSRYFASTAGRTLAPQQAFELEYAVSHHHDVNNSTATNPNLANVLTMYNDIPLLQAFYNNPTSITCSLPMVCTNDCVWPGDVDKNGWVDFQDAVYSKVGIGAAGLGRTLPSNTSWSPQNANNWTQTISAFNNLNYKHLDCDGSGNIDSADQAISTDQNYASYRTNYQAVYTTGNELYWHRFFANFFNLQDTIIQRGLDNSGCLRLRVNGTFSDVVALSYKIEYDPAVIQKSPLFSLIANKGVIYTDLYAAEERLHFPTTGLLDSQMLDNFIFQIRADAPMGQLVESTTIRLKDILAIRADGSRVPMGSQDIVVQYTDTAFTAISTMEELGTAYLFPNPSQGTLILQWEAGAELIAQKKCRYLIYNKLGQLIDSQYISSVLTTIQLPGNLPNDMYLISIQTPKEQSTHKILLQR